MIHWLWKYSGKCFGYRDGKDLWTVSGRHVGKFSGREIYGPDGQYLGETDDGRLFRRVKPRFHRYPTFTVYSERTAATKQPDLPAKPPPDGYKDFPEV